MEETLSVSLLFPAYNRLEFTKQAWAALIANTDWALVSEFHVYDDGSELAAKVWLKGQACSQRAILSRPVEFHDTVFRSPMGITLDWIRRSKAPFLAKLDNDTIYPPGWLNVALDVMRRHPELQMLGLECMRQPLAAMNSETGLRFRDNERFRRSYLPAQYVSGLFLGRREVFAAGLPEDNGYFGLEEFQQVRGVKAGWILPSLPVFLLDRLPMDPWRWFSESYVRKGWQRQWSGAGPLRYKPEQHEMWDWWQPCNL